MENTVLFQSFASSISDPRQETKVLYPLDGILLSSLCGVVSGCGSFVDVALYGEEKSGFLRKLATFEHGIPSRDTLSTVFRALDPEEFNAAFAAWASGLAGRVGGTVVAIDGKTARGSRAGGETPLHLIPAWCNDLRLVPGQQAGAHKKNGIRDIPVLLELLFPEGAVVTLDAMGCQRGIACKIRDKGADYVPALKGNQGLLHEDVKLWFEEQDQESTESLQTVDGDRGRIETRTYTQCDAIDRLKKRHPHREGLVSIGRVVPLRESGGKTTRQTRYFIPSLPKDAARLAHAVRSHRGIENRLHRVPDVTFRDDDSRIRKDHAPANFAVIRHIAMNLLNKAKSENSLGGMRKKAGWNNRFLLQILAP